MKSFEKVIRKIYLPKWIKLDFTTFDDQYRKIRGGFSCFKCLHKFGDNEVIALASFDKIGNKVMCRKCAADLLED